MSLTVHLPGELAAALEAEAARRGQSADQVAADLLAERLPLPGARRKLAFAAVGSSSSGHNAADADDMLAERIAGLVTTYASLRLGGTDASVVTLAERLGTTRIATLNHRHFTVVRPRHADAFELLP